MTYTRSVEEGDPAELIIRQPLSAPVDTITVGSDILTWEYNLRSEPGNPTDLLRFRRLDDRELEGFICDLAGQP